MLYTKNTFYFEAILFVQICRAEGVHFFQVNLQLFRLVKCFLIYSTLLLYV